jgi:hypothetical protein
MAEDQKKLPTAPPLEFLTTEHLKKKLQGKALTLTVEHYREALVAESMTTSHLQKNLAAVAKNQHQGETKEHGKGNSK